MDEDLAANTEDEVIAWMYGGGELRVNDADDIKECCVLTPLNVASLEINHKVS
jgi:hypothetical protein